MHSQHKNSSFPSANLNADARKSIQNLRLIMADLRHKEHGCPWDKEQDFQSIAPYTVDEAIEVAEAIAQKDMVELKYELGDLLLQVVYHAQLAEELNAFDFDDVVKAISDKMIHRHPHVFGVDDGPAISKDDVRTNWSALKAKEKEAIKLEKSAFAQQHQTNDALKAYVEAETRFLDPISDALPALDEAQQLTQKAAEVGFDWPDLYQVYDKLEEEMAEFKQALETGSVQAQQDEMGDILFSIVNVARHLNIEATEALKGTNKKFRRRFAHVEDRCAEQRIALEDAGLEQLDLFWNEARAADKA